VRVRMRAWKAVSRLMQPAPSLCLGVCAIQGTGLCVQKETLSFKRPKTNPMTLCPAYVYVQVGLFMFSYAWTLGIGRHMYGYVLKYMCRDVAWESRVRIGGARQ